MNSNMGVQLKLNAALSRRMASMTKDVVNMQAADLAGKLLREHEAKQATVDKKES